jgi:hypothetical protein
MKIITFIILLIVQGVAIADADCSYSFSSSGASYSGGAANGTFNVSTAGVMDPKIRTSG